MIFIAPDIMTPISIVFIITLSSFSFLILRKKKSIIVVLSLLITIFTISIQLGFNYELNALEQGEILGVGALYSDYSVDIQSYGTHISPQLSNWYTVFNLSIYFETNTSYVVFSLIENSQPEIQYFRGNYSTGSLEFILPTLYTSQGHTANWSFSFTNPSNEPLFLSYYVHAGMIEDAGISQMVYTEHYYTLPSKLLITFWIAIAIALLIIKMRGHFSKT